MSTGLIDIIKRAAIDVMDNSQMADIRLGEVVNVSPISVKLTHQLTIPSSILVVPEHLTNHNVKITIPNDDGTEESKEITMHNALEIGDKVALLRKQGGQLYFILDRI